MQVPSAFTPEISTGLNINSFIEFSPIAVLHLNRQGAIMEANQSFYALMRHALPAVTPLSLEACILPSDRLRFHEGFEAMLRGESPLP